MFAFIPSLGDNSSVTYVTQMKIYWLALGKADPFQNYPLTQLVFHKQAMI